MSAQSVSDAEAFYRFLGDQIRVNAPTKTPEELLDAWRRQSEYDETIAAVEEGARDAEAGKMRPLRELLGESVNALNRPKGCDSRFSSRSAHRTI